MTDKLINGPAKANCTLILAHGAGAGMDSPFMDAISTRLAEKNVRVLRFEFPYMQLIRENGKRRPPNSAKILISSFLKIIEETKGNVIIGGKSMGGRIASMILDESRSLGCICLGYPFHPPGRPEKLRTAHLENLNKPILILQGERDPFGKKEEVENYNLSDQIEIQWLKDGEHSLKPRKKSGRTWEENLQESAELIVEFIDRLTTD